MAIHCETETLHMIDDILQYLRCDMCIRLSRTRYATSIWHVNDARIAPQRQGQSYHFAISASASNTHQQTVSDIRHATQSKLGT